MPNRSLAINLDRSMKNGLTTWYSFFSSLLDPMIAICTLGVLVHNIHGSIRSTDLILGIVTFSLMYPSKAPFRKHEPHWIRNIIVNWMLVYFLLMFLGAATQSMQYFSPVMLMEWGLITPIALVAAHYASPKLLHRIVALQKSRAVLIVGATPLARKLIDNISAEPVEGLEVIGIFDDRAVDRIPEHFGPLLRGNLDCIQAYIKTHGVDRIMITLPMAQNPRILKLLDALRDTTASIYFVPDIFMSDLIQARVDTIGDLPVMAVCETPFHGLNGTVKRLSDIVLSILAILLFTPVMLVVALLIRWTSVGPIIYKQKRYGLDGKEIEMWKFRSMYINNDESTIKQATSDDPRVTAVGKFIRRTSLDELPQFFNVLQGRMSIVGPRPHAVSHNEMYRNVIKGYMVRHKVKPGITGLAQVSGARGETRTIQEMENRIALDLAYLRRWSLRMDLAILVRTVKVLFHDPKAY